jgi:uncharacterized protein YidB (DUF937 family)
MRSTLSSFLAASDVKRGNLLKSNRGAGAEHPAICVGRQPVLSFGRAGESRSTTQENIMGILDSLLKNPELITNVAKFAADNPQVAKAAAGLLSNQAGSPGGAAGLGDVLGALKASGLDDVVSSWLGSGSNKAISADQLQAALGSDRLSQFAQQAGIDSQQAGSVLAGLLPQLVDQLSPDGKLPESSAIQGRLSSLLGAVTA